MKNLISTKYKSLWSKQADVRFVDGKATASDEAAEILLGLGIEGVAVVEDAPAEDLEPEKAVETAEASTEPEDLEPEKAVETDEAPAEPEVTEQAEKPVAKSTRGRRTAK